MENYTANRDRTLPFKVKLCYSVGGFGKSLPTVMLMAYSLYFYNNLCGIDPLIVSTVILIARIWDFANDPLMAILVDRTRSGIGRCRIWLKYFSVPAGIAFALCFVMPDFAASGKVIWFIAFYVLQDMVGTATLVPINTLLGRITTNDAERAGINGMNGIFGLLANLVGGSFTLPLIKLFGGGSELRGFAWVGILYGGLFALSNLIVYWGTKGYDPVDEPLQNPKVRKEHVPAGESIKALVTNIPWLMCVGMYFFIMVAMGIYSGSQLYYFQFNLGNTGLYSIVNALTLFCSLAVYLFQKSAIKHLGCGRVGMIGALIMFAGFFVRFVSGDSSIVILLAGTIIGSFGQVLTVSVVMLMVLNAGIYGEWKTGVTHEAVLVSGYSVSYKIGATIATPIAGFLLSMVPWTEGAAVQEQSVLNLFFYENTLLPAAGGLFALVFAYFYYRYEKRFPEMRRETAERKAAQNR